MRQRITQLIRNIGYSGNFEIEFIEKAEGSLVFLEINFRHALSNYASTYGGIVYRPFCFASIYGMAG